MGQSRVNSRINQAWMNSYHHWSLLLVDFATIIRWWWAVSTFSLAHRDAAAAISTVYPSHHKSSPPWGTAPSKNITSFSISYVCSLHFPWLPMPHLFLFLPHLEYPSMAGYAIICVLMIPWLNNLKHFYHNNSLLF